AQPKRPSCSKNTTSAEKVEKVVRPPQKPVVMSTFPHRIDMCLFSFCGFFKPRSNPHFFAVFFNFLNVVLSQIFFFAFVFLVVFLPYFLGNFFVLF
ncbi:hypothetical protein SEEA0100_13908, partial [Salmonella enterica subsp. enterica serovar Anatum str. USDA 100]